MAHNARPSTATETGGKFGRWTKAATGKEPEVKLLQKGSMPKTTQRRHRVKRVK